MPDGTAISHSFWQSEFGADPNILSRSIRLSGHVFPIVGVTPPGFFGVEIGHRYDVAIPLCADPMFFDKSRIPNRTDWWLSFMGRLKPG
jgi:putative ABC transport system permease protein